MKVDYWVCHLVGQMVAKKAEQMDCARAVQMADWTAVRRAGWTVSEWAGRLGGTRADLTDDHSAACWEAPRAGLRVDWMGWIQAVLMVDWMVFHWVDLWGLRRVVEMAHWMVDMMVSHWVAHWARLSVGKWASHWADCLVRCSVVKTVVLLALKTADLLVLNLAAKKVLM